MDHFSYRDGVLYGDEVDLRTLADRFGTPLYVYSARTLIEHYDRIASAFAPLSPRICYAVKSCHNLAILKRLADHGSWFDVVSGGELARVVHAGIDPSRVVFAGVGKTDDEINAALGHGIGWFNVESEAELENVARLAALAGRRARVAIRVNPDVDPQSHPHTTTGVLGSKFGVEATTVPRMVEQFKANPWVTVEGLHVHLGSPVRSVEPFLLAIRKMIALFESIRGQGASLFSLNIGGGFGAHYDGEEALPAKVYAERIVPLLQGRGWEIFLEPGRSIAANAGILLTRVLYEKRTEGGHFVIVDAGMTELIRPALYGAFHFIWPIQPQCKTVPPARSSGVRCPGSVQVNVVGPICESGDFLGRNRWLPPVVRGDVLCVFSAGAYGSVMGSHYNSRPRPAEVLVDEGRVSLIRRREALADLWSLECP